MILYEQNSKFDFKAWWQKGGALARMQGSQGSKMVQAQCCRDLVGVAWGKGLANIDNLRLWKFRWPGMLQLFVTVHDFAHKDTRSTHTHKQQTTCRRRMSQQIGFFIFSPTVYIVHGFV